MEGFKLVFENNDLNKQTPRTNTQKKVFKSERTVKTEMNRKKQYIIIEKKNEKKTLKSETK